MLKDANVKRRICHFAFALLLFSVCTASSQLKVMGPAKVRAGDVVQVDIDPGRVPRNVAILYEFAGQRQVQPAVLLSFPASDSGVSAPVVQDLQAAERKAVVQQETASYTTLFKGRLPRSNDMYYLWVRKRGGAICLKNAENKEVKWVWSSSPQYQWIALGGYYPEILGVNFSIMAGPAGQEYAIDSVLFTTDPDFLPSGVTPSASRFFWQTDPSSIGQHSFPVQVSVGGKVLGEATYTVEVEAPQQTLATAFRGEGFQALPLTAANVSSEPQQRNLRFFNPKDLAAGENKFGPYIFQLEPMENGVGVIALRSTKAPEAQTLPQMVTIPVERKAAGLVFVHGEFGGLDFEKLLMTYQINYANGAKVDVPIKVGESVMGILKPVEATDAVMVKEWFSGTITYRLYLLEWENPYPEETIAGIDIVSSGSASVPIIVGLGTFTGMKEAMPKDSRIDRTIYLTADFRQVKGKIDPRLFGTNDTEALVSSPLKDGDYQNYMAKIAPSLVRLHLSGRMEAIFPTKESEPNYEDITVGMDRTFDRDDRQGQRILFCFAQAPAWVDLTKEEDRKLYAQKVAQMADYLVNKKKYPIDYWQVFNEPYGRGVAEDRSVWLFYNEVAPLLKKVTPHVQVGGPVLNYPDVGIIKDFLKYCAPNVDFISWHKYPTGSVDTPTQLLMARTGEFGHDSLAVREAARQFIADRDIEMSLTEYNMNYDWRPYHDPRRATNVGAVWMASVLKHLADVDHEIALTWHSKGGGTFGLISADNEVRPTADLLMLLNKHLAGAERIASRSSDEFVEILAAQNQEQYCILVINKSADEQVVKLTTLNGPKAESDPFSRQVLNYEISGAQTNYEQGNISFFSSAISGSLTMSPYSVQLLVFNRN